LVNMTAPPAPMRNAGCIQNVALFVVAAHAVSMQVPAESVVNEPVVLMVALEFVLTVKAFAPAVPSGAEVFAMVTAPSAICVAVTPPFAIPIVGAPVVPPPVRPVPAVTPVMSPISVPHVTAPLAAIAVM
jgi:hypothetical protein